MVRSPTVTRAADFASGPLAGVRVLDLSRVLAGPYVGRLFADMGAEVIKLEPPDGDESRTIAPKHDRGESWLFAFSNVGKRDLALDLGKPGASEVLVALARTCDVVIENFRPGVLERLGLSWQRLHAANPRAVLLSINGFGSGSSFADRRAYAPIVHAATGLLRDRGQLGEKPSQPRNAFSDVLTALHGAVALLAALRVAEATGMGQHVEVAMFDATLASHSEAGNVLLDPPDERVMNPIYDAGAHGWIAAAHRIVPLLPIVHCAHTQAARFDGAAQRRQFTITGSQRILLPGFKVDFNADKTGGARQVQSAQGSHFRRKHAERNRFAHGLHLYLSPFQKPSAFRKRSSATAIGWVMFSW